MPAADDLREGLAEAYNVLADEFLDGVTVALCKASGTSDAFTSLYTVSTARFFEYSNFRKNLLLEIASTAAALTTAMDDATHLSISGEYWVINKADTVAPTGTNPVWQIFAERFENRRTHYTNL